MHRIKVTNETSVSFVTPKVLGTSQKRRQEDYQSQISGRTSIKQHLLNLLRLMNSQQLLLPAQELSMVKPWREEVP